MTATAPAPTKREPTLHRTIRVPAALWERAAALTAEHGTDRSAVMVDALTLWVAQHDGWSKPAE